MKSVFEGRVSAEMSSFLQIVIEKGRQNELDAILAYFIGKVKEYNNIEFEAGEYESLVVEIGEAKGNNYWCILYPPLCMVDYEKDTKIEYKSKIVEILSNLF